MNVMPQYEIDINKTYTFPKEIQVVNYKGEILVIAPEFANWIVINSLAQQNILEFLMAGHTIKETLSGHGFHKNDVNYVITQIEARHLCNKKVHSAIDEERGLHLYLTNRCNLT